MVGLLDPSPQGFRGLLAQSPAAQGQLTGLSAPPQYGAQLPNRSTPLWFGGPLAKGMGQGAAPWASPQQNSYWPQLLALLQNPLQLPQAPGVQPIPQFPQGGNPVPITPGMLPPQTPGTPPGTGVTLPPGISTLPLPQPTPLPGQTLPPGGVGTGPVVPPKVTPAPAAKKKLVSSGGPTGSSRK